MEPTKKHSYNNCSEKSLPHQTMTLIFFAHNSDIHQQTDFQKGFPSAASFE
jgi:hypothetical protein